MMNPLRLPRWSAVLVLPLLVGALLLMHGLDSQTSTTPLHGTTPASLTDSGDAAGQHDDEHCSTCTAGHVVAVCVAIVATAVGLHLARRAMSVRVGTRVTTTIGWVRAARELLRPPEPAWVRLAVMRC